jgi:phosphoribosylamine---glycine ligase
VRILIIGSGSKEHALVWKFLSSEKFNDPEIYVCPGNFALRKIVDCIDADINDTNRLLEIAIARNIDLTIVGESHLFSKGIVDEFKKANKLILGPSQVAAEIESSNFFAKNFMIQNSIPSPRCALFEDINIVNVFLPTLKYPVRIRPDKVFNTENLSTVVYDLEQAKLATEELLRPTFFEKDTPRIVIEEILDGHQITINTLADGNKALSLPPVQAYRESDDYGHLSDRGAFAPTPVLSDELMAKIRFEIIDPTMEALSKENRDYSGMLCFDIVLDKNDNNKPKLIQYRTNLLDSDSQVILPLLDEEIYEILSSAARNDLSFYKDGFHKFTGSALAINVVSSDKTEDYITPIHSLELLENINHELENYQTVLSGIPLMFYGTKMMKQNYAEVFGATAVAETLVDAQILAYKLADSLQLPSKTYDRNIGDHGLI